MTTKIYAYLGKNQASIDFPVSATGSFHVDFTGGNIYDRKAYRLAQTKAIADPVIQAVIEGSTFFGRNVILLEERINEEPVGAPEVKEYPDVTTFAAAAAVLKADYQAKATQLRSPAGVKALAQSLNVSFPNWGL